MKLFQLWLPCLISFIFMAQQNSMAQKKSKMIFVGANISRITEKPFNYSNGQKPGIRPMFEYQVEKNIFGGYYYTYGIGIKSLVEGCKLVEKNHPQYDIKVTQGWKIDTIFTYVGELTRKYQIKLRYIYLPVGLYYYAGEKLAFGAEYSLAYAWSGNYSFDRKFSDIVNNYKYDYSVNADLNSKDPSDPTAKKWMHRWDHWIRFSARYKFNDIMFRVGFEKGLRNICTGNDAPATSDGKPISLDFRDVFWQNTSIYLIVGIKLPN